MPLREKCLNTEIFWCVFSPIRTGYGEEYFSLFIPNAEKYRPKKSPYLDTFDAVNVTTIYGFIPPTLKTLIGLLGQTLLPQVHLLG